MRTEENKDMEKIAGMPIISTRPREKWIPPHNIDNLNIVNIPLTKLIVRKIGVPDIVSINNFSPDVIILTSSFGASIFLDSVWTQIKRAEIQFISVGESTANTLEKTGIESFTPVNRSSEGIIEMIKERIGTNKRFLILRSNRGNTIINDFFNSNGVEFEEKILYDIYQDEESAPTIIDLFRHKPPEGIILTSSMEAEIFFNILRNGNIGFPHDFLIFAIGKPTSQKIRSFGYSGKIITGDSNFDGILKKIEEMKNSGEWI
ncbi:MAG: uroporphyrinogen-III synthase [Thermoplasmataceae archaeon]